MCLLLLFLKVSCLLLLLLAWRLTLARKTVFIFYCCVLECVCCVWCVSVMEQCERKIINKINEIKSRAKFKCRVKIYI